MGSAWTQSYNAPEIRSRSNCAHSDSLCPQQADYCCGTSWKASQTHFPSGQIKGRRSSRRNASYRAQAQAHSDQRDQETVRGRNRTPECLGKAVAEGVTVEELNKKD